MIQIKLFFKRGSNYTWNLLTYFLNHIFLKNVYDLEFNWFQALKFLHPIIHLHKIKKLRWTCGEKLDFN